MIQIFSDIKSRFKSIKWEELKYTCWFIAVLFSFFDFLMFEYLLEYFDIWSYFPFLKILGVKKIFTFLFSAFSLYPVKESIPHSYIFSRSVVGYKFSLVSCFFDGFFTNPFSLLVDKFKIILLNHGGSPYIKHRWSKISLSRYLMYIIFVLSIFVIDFYSHNGLNNGLYIPFNEDLSIKYTFGLVFLILVLFWLIIRFSILGVNLHRFSTIFYSLDLFKFFIAGEKIPAVLQENLFTLICAGNWHSVKDLKYLHVNDKRESLLLPGHFFFFGLGRIIQVLLRMLFKVLGLFLFFLLILALFNLIFNYVSSDQFGDSSYSFYQVVVSNNLSYKPINSFWLNDNIFSNIIVSNENIMVNNEHSNKGKGSFKWFFCMLVFDFLLCCLGGGWVNK